MRRNRVAFAMFLLAAVLPAARGSADWLVTREGGRVETKGPWKVRGKLVVFTQAGGTLSSLRLADVDLDASEKITAEVVAAAARAAEPREHPRVEKKEAVFVVTDETLKKSAPPAEPATEGAEAGAAVSGVVAATGAASGDKGRSPVVVDNWRQVRRTEGDGIEILGTLRNSSGAIAAEAGVTVKLYDENGKLLATADGVLSMPSIKPESSTSFRASFPGLFAFADIKFETKGWGLKLDTPKADAADEQQP
jgi:hypothetical protein